MGEAFRGVAVHSCSAAGLYSAVGPNGALEECPTIGVNDRYLHELHGGR